MSLTTSDLSLKGFASIDATSSKHDSFVTRALLALVVEMVSADDIVVLIQSTDAADVYKEMCKHIPTVDRRVRMVDAVLTFFDNVPELAEKFAARKQEWEYIKELVEEQMRESVAEYVCGMAMATGMTWTIAVKRADTLSRLLKCKLPTVDLESTIRGTVDRMADWAESDEEMAKPWKKQLELLGLF
jgi:hypothetical protein